MQGEIRSGLKEAFALALGIAGVLVVVTFPYLLNAYAYYRDDMQAQFAPMYSAIGVALRHGVWPDLTLQVNNGGAMLSEYEYALLNPFCLLNDVLASFFDTLPKAAFASALYDYGVMGAGTYWLARALGARRDHAVLAAIAFASNGFVYYWYATSWRPAMTGTAWLCVGLASLVQARRGPWSFVFAALGAFGVLTAGWPQAVVAYGVVALVLTLGAARARDWKGATAFGLAAAIGGLASLDALLPLLAMGSAAGRTNSVFNYGLLQPNFYSVLSVSSPFQFGRFEGFKGPEPVMAPIFFAGWHILPLAAFLDWEKVKKDRTLTAVLGLSIACALATQGPQQLSFLRWPFRFLPYFHLGLIVAFSRAASLAGFIDSPRRRLAAASLIGLGFLSAFQLTPALVLLQAAAAAVMLLGVYLLAPRLAGRHGAGAVGLIVLILLVLTGVTRFLAPANGNVPDWGAPADKTRFADISAVPQSYHLVIGALGRDGAIAPGRPKFGNMRMADAEANIFGYSPIGEANSASAFCIETHGLACPGLTAVITRPSGLGDLSYADLLKVDEIDFLAPADRQAPLPGWRCEASGPGLACKRMTPRPQTAPGSLSYASPGLVVTPAGRATADRERLSIVASGAGPGLLVFDRVAWPGYRVVFNGRALPLRRSPLGLLSVDLPAGGTGGVLDVRYEAPGAMMSLMGFLLATALLAGAVVGWRRWAPTRGGA